jgi:glycosyltransferase involved in cell wall biosynthesis
VPAVIVPVLNEATALPALLSALPAGYQAIVVDNGSTDGSAEVAAAPGRGSSERTGAGSAPPGGPG